MHHTHCSMQCTARCDARCDAMHLVGTHERDVLVETSRLGAGAATTAADAARVEGEARRAGRPARRVRWA